MEDPKRKIPFNYTSADDDQIIRHLFGSRLIHSVQTLAQQEHTGRSSRRLYRFMGDLFILERNPFLFREMVEHPKFKKRLFSEYLDDLAAMAAHEDQPNVSEVLDACRDALDRLKKKIRAAEQSRQEMINAFSQIIGRHNIYLDPFSLTAHATDATDWRRFLPAAVLRPETRGQVENLILKSKSLGLKIVPRGGGTGLTGGAVPVAPGCVMINTEKLNRIGEIVKLDGVAGKNCAMMEVQAGVITQDAMDTAKAAGYVFATDPTSAWACTIGGNLSENAGGKKAVLFGTAIDNVLSYDIVLPDGISYEVRRRNHPARRILPEETVIFDIFRQNTGEAVDTIEIPGNRLRKKGLGKDVTNKALNGLPGIQKEGCDGIITAARFILYPEFRYEKTLCIEFFGNDMSQAAQVIKKICDAFAGSDPPFLAALEHFDEAYIKAIHYKTKTSVGNRLLAVLLVDMAADETGALDQGIQVIETIMEEYDRTGLSVAKDAAEAVRFWQDRKRLGAIAAHTKSFKLNEDIVLPIDSLAEFARFADELNIREKKFNQVQTIENIAAYLGIAVPVSDPELLRKRAGQAKDLAYQTRKKLDIASRAAIEAGIHAKNFYGTVMDSLRGFTVVSDRVREIYEQTQARLIVIATHMHAGDGNVHVNIPVLSNDREMMHRASETADIVMEKSMALGGAVSGEHGIGITKFKHLEPERIADLQAYRAKIDPSGMMNPGKLDEADIIDKVFTPSFNLLEVEARILKHGDLAKLAEEISSCVRCGRCKPACAVFYPEQNLFYHPRNKNLSIASLIEAVLYISQRTQSADFKIIRHIEQLADHCTMCHKCFDKCPVNIDTALISIKEKNVLQKMGYKHTAPATKMTLAYLSQRGIRRNRILRTGFLKTGARAQRIANRAAGLLRTPVVYDRVKSRTLLSMTGSPVSMPDPADFRTFLPSAAFNQAMLIQPEGAARASVFYFPGCGSERVFSRIASATVFLMLASGVQVVLPPPFMCCSYPFLVNGKQETYDKMVLENVLVLTQIREMVQDIRFDACIISCGTCMESLQHMEAESIFDAPVTDVSIYALGLNPDLRVSGGGLYHAPCHDSMKGQALKHLEPHLADGKVTAIPHCCSEAGTGALSRPDISHAMLERKGRTIKEKSGALPVRVLTNCPSCLQGLGRHGKNTTRPEHLAVELAAAIGGTRWLSQLKTMTQNSKAITF